MAGMNTFLYETTLSIYQRHMQQMDEVDIVVPGKRAAIYMRKYLGQIAGKVSWSPGILTISEWFERLAAFSKADRLVLLNELYLTYNHLFEDEAMTIDQFWPLGEILLHDFNELDNYAEQPLTILRQLAGMQDTDSETAFTEEQKRVIQEFLLHFRHENLSVEKSQYWNILKKLPLIYESYTRKLQRLGFGYDGLQGQILLKKIAKEKIDIPSNKHIYIVGFNALNIIQIRLFEHLMQHARIGFFWDADDYYISDERQEAGLFLRESLQMFGNAGVNVPIRNLSQRTEPISLISASGAIAQAEAVATLLSQIPEKTRIAVIMADETLLLPILQRIPAKFGNLNITLGYSIKYSYLYNLIQLLLTFYEQLHTNQGIYIPDLLSFLRNPIVKKGMEHEVQEFEKFLVAQYEPYISATELQKSKMAVFNSIEQSISTPAQLSEKLLHFIYSLYAEGKQVEEVVQHNIIDEFYFLLFEQIQRMTLLLIENNAQISLSLFIQILKSELEKIEISLQGDTSDGLQIMGVLESRNLDFEHVIFVGANDDVFPKTGNVQSFLPESVRHYFKLPVAKQKNAIFAYYFYRAMQRANHIDVIYNGTSEKGGAEVTRYVKQIEMESKFGVQEYLFYQNLVLPTNTQAIEVHKTDEILEHLKLFTTHTDGRAFSASLLSKYIQCSLQFYFSEIAGLSAPSDFVEEMEANTYGNLLHSALYKLYLPFLGKTIDKNDFLQLKKQVAEVVTQVYREKFNQQEPGGLYIIARKALEEHIGNVLAHDQQKAPFGIVGLEKRERMVFVTQSGLHIKLKGTLDRVQRRNNMYEIIDYKTGTSALEAKTVDILFDNTVEHKKDIFQQLLYTLMLQKSENSPQLAIPNIYMMSEISARVSNTEISIGKTDLVSGRVEIMKQFEEKLNFLFEEIFSPETPFTQTTYDKNCTYCDFKQICRR